MVLKAARGAGFPLGQAEDLARTASYVAGIGGDAAIITGALTEAVSTPVVTWEGDHLTIKAGAVALIAPVICDAFAMGCDRVTFHDPRHSAYIAAALAVAGVPLWYEGCIISRGDSEIIPAHPGPISIAQEDWDIWQALAAKTYVPESDASRLAGAGAGLTDND